MALVYQYKGPSKIWAFYYPLLHFFFFFSFFGYSIDGFLQKDIALKKLPLNFLVGDLAEFVTWVMHLVWMTEPGLLFRSPHYSALLLFLSFFFFSP